MQRIIAAAAAVAGRPLPRPSSSAAIPGREHHGLGNCHTPQGPERTADGSRPVRRTADRGRQALHGRCRPTSRPIRRPASARGQTQSSRPPSAKATPMGPDHRQPYATLLGAGGMPFNGPWGLSVAENITSDARQGLGKWTEASDGPRLLQQGFSRRHGRADRLVAQPAAPEDAVDRDRLGIIATDTKFTGAAVGRYAALTGIFSFRQILSSIRWVSLRNPR